MKLTPKRRSLTLVQLSVVDQRYQQSVELLTGVALEEIQNHHSLTLGVLELYQGTADQEVSWIRTASG